MKSGLHHEELSVKSDGQVVRALSRALMEIAHRRLGGINTALFNVESGDP